MFLKTKHYNDLKVEFIINHLLPRLRDRKSPGKEKSGLTAYNYALHQMLSRLVAHFLTSIISYFKRFQKKTLVIKRVLIWNWTLYRHCRVGSDIWNKFECIASFNYMEHMQCRK